MTEWEPGTDAEVAMRNALRTDDQESYFRILAGVDLLLPVSADALAGLAPMGWGTWSTGGRTHVLAFTSPSALQACLSDYSGSARRVAYAELAETWPNLEWWLAVNPGLPIEGYLPAWFVAQLSRGDLRLPKRGPARDGAAATGRMKDLHAAAMAANAAAAQDYASPASGGPVPAESVSGAPVSGYDTVGAGAASGGGWGAGGPGAGGYGQGAAPGLAAAASPERAPAGFGAPGGSAAAAYGGAAAGGGAAAAFGASGGGAERVAAGSFGQGASAAGARYGDGGPPDASPVGPGGLPVRTPGAVLPSGLPSRVPSTPPGLGAPGGSSSFSGFTTGGGGSGRSGGPGSYGAQGEAGPGASPSAFAGAPSAPGSGTPGGSAPNDGPAPGAGLTSPGAPGGGAPSGGAPSGGAPSGGAPSGGAPGRGGAPAAGVGGGVLVGRGQAPGSAVPSGSALDALASRSGTAAPSGGPSALDALGSRSGASTRPAETRDATDEAVPELQRPDAPLPTRTPLAQTPPVPGHIPAPGHESGDTEDGSAGQSATAPAGEQQATADATSTQEADGDGSRDAEQAGPGGLPRRQVTPPSERPSSMAAAAQALAARGAAGASPAKASDDQSIDTATTSTDLAGGTPLPSRAGVTRPSLAPPVIPGAGGANRTGGPVPEPAFRPSVPGGLPTRSGGPGVTRPGEERPAAGYSADTERIVLPQAGLAAARPAAGQTREQQAHAEHYPAVTERIVVPQANYAPAEDDFLPANEVERDLYQATLDHSTDSFLSTLLLATVLVPVADNSRPGSSPGESGFAFRTEEMDGERFLVVFTSRDRLGDHYAEPARTVAVRFVELIRNWPDPAWSFAVNPGTAVGAKYPGPQVIALANWAIEAGLGGDPAEDVPVSSPALPQQATEEALPTTMQKAVPAEQIDYYLERGYDRVAGFVHRAAEVEHLRSPGELFAALGLLYDGSPYQADAKEAFVLRWPAFRPSLYRIPYGGQSEQALRAMDGWVIERPPFRGNGFAPGEGKDVIAEFKVDSVRLPHGAELWRLDADGGEQMIATFDCDAPVWRRVGEGTGDA